MIHSNLSAPKMIDLLGGGPQKLIALEMKNHRLGGVKESAGAKESDRTKARESAQQFEGILLRQLLQPLEKSLAGTMGGQGASPMVGGMIVSGLSQSIVDGGGLGLASVIEEALRDPPAPQVSSREGSMTQLEPLAQAVRGTETERKNTKVRSEWAVLQK